jgi:hypothetical protein
MYDIDELKTELVKARTQEEEFSVSFNMYRIDYENGMVSISSSYSGENLKFTFNGFMDALVQSLNSSRNSHADF